MSVSRSKDGKTSKQERPRACDYCRLKKIRCDGLEKPGKSCTHCLTNNKDCTYDTQSKRRGPTKSYVASLELRLAGMQKLLEQHVPPAELAKELGLPAPSPRTSSGHATDDVIRPHDSNDVSDANEPSIRLREQLQKYMDNIGQSPPSAESNSDPNDSDDDREFSFNGGLRKDEGGPEYGRYHGESSGFRFAQTARNLKKEYAELSHIEAPSTSGKLWHAADWERALWTDEKNLSAEATFPPVSTIYHLFALFFRHIQPFLPVIHQPTFEAQFEDGLHRRDSRFAVLVLLVCAVATKYDDNVGTTNGPDGDVGWRCFAQTRDWTMSLAPATLADLQGWVLTAHYLAMTGNPHAAWTMLGVAARFAFDSGVHVSRARARRSFKDPTSPSAIEYEQWKRAFWCLITLDRDISAGLGRTPACREEDLDIDLPREDLSSTGEFSDIAYFNCTLRLGQLLSFTLRSIYTVKRPLVLAWLGERWEERIVAELDSALEKWLASVPDHLRWDPERANPLHFKQSSMLQCSYWRLIILIHRPFIPAANPPSPSTSPLAPSALDICTNAARKCVDVVGANSRRGIKLEMLEMICGFLCAIVILTKVWGTKKASPTADVKYLLRDVKKYLVALKATEDRWVNAGVLVDIIRELAGFGDLPLDSPSLDDDIFPHDDVSQMGPFGTTWSDPSNLFQAPSMDTMLNQPITADPSTYDNMFSSLAMDRGYDTGSDMFGSLGPNTLGMGPGFEQPYPGLGSGDMGIRPGETYGGLPQGPLDASCENPNGAAGGLMGMWSCSGDASQQWDDWTTQLANVQWGNSTMNPGASVYHNPNPY